MPDTITAPPAAPSRNAPSTFSALADAFLAWFAVFVIQLNAVVLAMNWNALTSTSTTSDTIALGSTSLTVDASKGYLPGHSVKIARTAAPSNWMHGDVTSYNSGTGALVVNVTTISGSGTFTDWTVTFSAPISPGLAITPGKTITCVENTTLDEAVAMSSKANRGAEQIKICTYTHVITSGEIAATAIDISTDASDLSKVRSLFAGVHNNANVFTGLLAGWIAGYYFSSPGNLHVALGASAEAGHIISVTVIVVP